ncbi:MAG: hypothetical protein Q4E09_05980 [Eubacteriales bacterium]|nr:hypothetical protein [Eubacteriales bacterium]
MTKNITGKTLSGFEFELNPIVLNDYELLEDLAEVEENPIKATAVIERILGKDQKNRLLDHVRGEDGVAKIDSVMEEFANIFNAASDLKNS